MNIDIQLNTQKLILGIRNRIQHRPMCNTDIFDIQGQQYLLDHVELPHDAVIESTPATADIMLPSGATTQISAYMIRFSQPLELHIVSLHDLEANNAAPSAPAFDPALMRIVLYFNLSLKMAGGVPMFHFSYDSIEAGNVGNLAPHIIDKIIATVESLASDTPFDFSAIEKFLGKEVSVSNTGIDLSEDRSCLTFRLQIPDANPLSDQDVMAAWENFYNGKTPNRLGGGDWSIMLDKELIFAKLVPEITQKIQESSEFNLESGPTPSWKGNGCNVHMRGSASAFIFTIHADVDMDFGFAINEPNILTTTASYGIDYDNWDIAFAAIFSALIGALIGALLGGGVGAIFGAGLMGAGIGMAIGGLAGSLSVIIVSSTYEPSVSAPTDFQQTGENTFEGKSRFTIPYNALLGSFEANQIVSCPDGLAVAGQLRNVEVSRPQLSVYPSEFSWAIRGSCSSGWNIRNCCSARFVITQENLFSICNAEILPQDDPLGQFANFTVVNADLPSGAYHGLGICINQLLPDYLANPYPGKVLLQTNAGARYLTFAPPSSMTDEQHQKLELQIPMRKADCVISMAPLWERLGRLVLKWLPDPPPDEKVRHLWDISVTGVRDVEQFAIVDYTGQQTAIATPTLHNEVRLSTLQAPSHNPRITLMRNEQKVATRSRISERNVLVRQTVVAEEPSIALPAECCHLSGGNYMGFPTILATTAHGLYLYDVSRRGFARFVDCVPIKGLAGALPWQDGIVLWGPQSLQFRTSDTRSLKESVSGSQIKDVIIIGSRLCVLTETGATLLDKRLRAIGTVKISGACRIAGSAGSLVVSDGSSFLTLQTGDRKPLRISSDQLRSRPFTHLQSAEMIGYPNCIYFSNGESGGDLMEIDTDGTTNTVARFAKRPWFDNAVIAGNKIARLNSDTTAINVLASLKTVTL